ncbi:Fc receptor-like protein 5 isoform X2 [Bufo gargarizans]|uniref:Fc receptor-like protein 5 isoform X2 n=1 Tax=Bufo gargarizans TaxID=30331 RepID=UPI001CF3ED31|nr:Fc receptor-like protein 5 isoform X2 [Bufo gargarizans]
MRSLCVLCVFLSMVQGEDIFTRSGSDVLLPLRYNLSTEKDKCDVFIWEWSYNGSSSSPISRSVRCKMRRYNITKFTNDNTSKDGHLTLTAVTKNNSGIYTVTVRNVGGNLILQENYNLQVQEPVSELLLNVSCLPDGGADIVCRTDVGDDPKFSIMVNGGFRLENSTSSRTVGDANEVNVPAVSPGPWNITCSVRNRVSESETNKKEVICPVPPSDLVLEDLCLQNGSLQVSCSVENGTDLLFSLSVNNTLLEESTKEQKRVIVTLSSSGPWHVNCSARNDLGEKSKTKSYPACPVPPSDPVLGISCYNGSLQISCSVEKGTDPIFSLSVNGILLLENVQNEQKMVNYTSSSSGPWNVYCSVRNNLGEKNKSVTYQTCSVPLSAPIINATCQNDGTARVVCEVERASDATYAWSVNGKHFHLRHAPNITIDASEFASGAINVSCSAENSVSKENSSSKEIFCDVHSESSCLSCLEKSLIGGAVALIVTTSPLLIAYFYIGQNAKKE